MEAAELDYSITRKDRIYWLHKDLDKAKWNQDVPAQQRIEKEIQIQQAYLQIEG